jgi:hypothetical protein
VNGSTRWSCWIIDTRSEDAPVITEGELIWEPKGKEEVFYEVSLRIDAAEQMARKAASNALQVSDAGPLRVRVLKRVPVAPGNDMTEAAKRRIVGRHDNLEKEG